MAFELYPHQQEALKKMKNGSILCGGVGSGKSAVGLAYYLDQETPEKILIVITTAKKRDSLDWEREAARFTIGKARDATVAGCLWVDSWNNIGKYVGVENAFFIFDEQRLVGAGAWNKAFHNIVHRNNWILLSATPGDTWLDYIPVFIANGYYKNRTEFKREHVVYNTFAKFPKVDHYIQVSRLVKHRNSILVKMPYARSTVRHPVIVDVDYNQSLVLRATKDRWNVYEERPLRDAGELVHLLRRISNSDKSRVAAVRTILKKHPRLIVFYNFDYELEALRGLASDFVVAEWNGHRHDELPDGDSWVYLVQYVAGSEGWNCVRTDAICLFSLTYSYKNWEQAFGRIDRLDTQYVDLWYYILLSKAPIDMAIWKALRGKKSFNSHSYEKAWQI